MALSLTPTSASPIDQAPVTPGVTYGSPLSIGFQYVGNTYPSSNVSSEPPKKKQKRNKPTLSCEECVERKTKVGPVAPTLPRGLSFGIHLSGCTHTVLW